MHGVNILAKPGKHIWFEILKNYVINCSTRGTTSLYVLALLVSCCPVVLCFVTANAEFLRCVTSNQ